MENSVNIMRLALIVSIIGHVVFMLFTDRDLRPTAHGETIEAEIITPDQVPGANKSKNDDASAQAKTEKTEPKPEPKAEKPAEPQTKQPEPKPQLSKAQETKPQEPKAPDAKTPETKVAQPRPDPLAQLSKWAAQNPPPPAQQQPAQSQPTQVAAVAPPTTSRMPVVREVAPNMNRLAETLGLPVGEGPESEGAADPMAKVTEGVRELKAQVRKCYKLPAGVAPNQRVRTRIIVRLRQDGTLAEAPEPKEFAASEFGPAVMDGAMRALRQCAPYRMPTDKYEQWKVLDIDFSPDQMMGS